jgi:hypothetical protein
MGAAVESFWAFDTPSSASTLEIFLVFSQPLGRCTLEIAPRFPFKYLVIHKMFSDKSDGI